jgi:type I restriction enzyme, S subunit
VNSRLPRPTVALGDLVDILSGFAFKSERFAEAGELPVVRIRDVKRGYSNTFYSGEYDDRYLVNDGDLLIGMDGEFNRERWRGGRALLNQRVCKLTSDPLHLSSDYLYHFLPKVLKDIEDRTPFATVKHLSSKGIMDIQIPLPPLDEQRRIAAILDKADALRRKRKRALKLLDSLTQAIFLEMFGEGAVRERQYERRPVAEIALLVTDGEHQTPKRTSSGIKLLSARNIQMGYIDTSDVDFIDQQEYERISKRLVLQPTDVLVSCSGTIGRVSLLRLTEPVALVRSVAVIRPKEGIVPLYLEHYLQSPRMQSAMKAAANSSGQPNLFQNQIKRLEIVVSPIKLQNTFARKVEEVRRLAPSLASSEQCAQQFFSSLQSRAFSGQL